MTTLAVMCMALIRHSPSLTPLSRTASSTCGVMFRKSIRAGTLKVRYWVCDFMVGSNATSAAARSFVASRYTSHQPRVHAGRRPDPSQRPGQVIECPHALGHSPVRLWVHVALSDDLATVRSSSNRRGDIAMRGV